MIFRRRFGMTSEGGGPFWDNCFLTVTDLDTDSWPTVRFYNHNRPLWVSANHSALPRRAMRALPDDAVARAQIKTENFLAWEQPVARESGGALKFHDRGILMGVKYSSSEIPE